QLGHAVRVHVRRVAEDEVPGAGAGGEAVALNERDAIGQPVFVDVDACDLQRLAREVGAGDAHLGPGHGGQHGQAAVAGAQVQHAHGGVAQPGVDAAVGDELGDEAARHDGAAVHVEGHAL